MSGEPDSLGEPRIPGAVLLDAAIGRRCQACGKACPGQARYCGNCGARLGRGQWAWTRSYAACWAVGWLLGGLYWGVFYLMTQRGHVEGALWILAVTFGGLLVSDWPLFLIYPLVAPRGSLGAFLPPYYPRRWLFHERRPFAGQPLSGVLHGFEIVYLGAIFYVLAHLHLKT